LITLDSSILESPSDSLSDDSSEQDTRIPINVHTSEPTSCISRLYILIVAHTSTGFRIGNDILLGKDISPKKGKKGKKGQKPHAKGDSPKSDVDIVSDLIDECVQGFIEELADQPGPDGDHGSVSVSEKRSCLDRHMRDQIVVFEALGELHRDKTETGSQSQVREDERYWTLHTRTAQWVCAKMLE
jgi:RNA 3'-terminal phosphate cyclase (ATP)